KLEAVGLGLVGLIDALFEAIDDLVLGAEQFGDKLPFEVARVAIDQGDRQDEVFAGDLDSRGGLQLGLAPLSLSAAQPEQEQPDDEGAEGCRYPERHPGIKPPMTWVCRHSESPSVLELGETQGARTLVGVGRCPLSRAFFVCPRTPILSDEALPGKFSLQANGAAFERKQARSRARHACIPRSRVRQNAGSFRRSRVLANAATKRCKGDRTGQDGFFVLCSSCEDCRRGRAHGGW